MKMRCFCVSESFDVILRINTFVWNTLQMEHTSNGILKYNLTHSLKLSLIFIYLLRFTLFLFCFNYFIYTWRNRFNYVFKSSYFGEAYENALFSNKKPFQSLFYTAICHP